MTKTNVSKLNKKGMLVAAVVLLLAAALFVGAGAAATTEVGDWNALKSAISSASTDPVNPDQIKLTANITDGNAELNINGKFITIDGDGHILTITHSAAKAAILIQGNGGVTLKNITIVGPSSTAEPTWATGRIAVKVFGGENFFDGVTIKNGTEAILVDGAGTTLTLKGTNHFEDNLYNGIEVHNNGCELILDSGVTVTTKANPKADTNLEHAYIWVDNTDLGTSEVTTNGKAISVTHPKAEQLYWVIGGDEVAQIVVDGVTYKFASLTEAYAALCGKFSAKNDLTITLLKDYTGGGIGKDGDAAKTYTIDFGRHTYTVSGPAVGSTGTQTQAFRVLSGQTVTLKNGTLDIAASNKEIQSGNRVVWLINSYGALTLENMTLDGKNLNLKHATEGTNDYIHFILNADSGTVNITGKTKFIVPEQNPAAGARAGDRIDAISVSWGEDYTKGSEVTINTTDAINGNIVFHMDAAPAPANLSTNGPKLTIDGGTFNGDLVVDPAINVDVTVDSKTKKYPETAIKINGGSFTDPTVAQYVQPDKSISVKLDKDYGKDDAGCHVVVPAGATVTLDLNGFTINGGTGTANKDKATITNNGTLTIKDTAGNGIIKRADTDTASGYYVIVNNGNLTINSGKVTNNTGIGAAGNSLICNAVTAPATLTVNGGELVQPLFNVIKTDDFTSKVIINGGTISCDKDYAILNYDELEIHGGTIKGPLGLFGYRDDPDDVSSKVTITGGTFIANTDAAEKGLSVLVYSDGVPAPDKIPTTLPSAEIKGGNFGADYDLIVGYGKTHGVATKETTKGTYGTISVTGGTFQEDPSKYVATGYHWDSSTKQVVKDTPMYTVTFDANGGTPTPAAQTVEQGQTVSKPATDPTKEGTTFTGWFKGTEAYNFNLPVTESFMLTAQYEEEPVLCTVTFDADGGVPVPAPQTVAYGGYVLEPQTNPSKGEEYEFLGWFLEGSTVKYDFMSYQVIDEFTLTAHWKVKEVTEKTIEEVIETAEAGKEVVVEVTADNKGAVEELVKQAQESPDTAKKVQLEVTPNNTTVLAEVINDTQEEIVTPVPVVVTNNNKGAVETLLNNVDDESKVSLPIDGNGTNITTVLDISKEHPDAKVQVPEVIVVAAPVTMTMGEVKTVTLAEIAAGATVGGSAEKLTLDLVLEDLNVQDAVSILGADNVDGSAINVIQEPEKVVVTTNPGDITKEAGALTPEEDARIAEVSIVKMEGVTAAAVSKKNEKTIEEKKDISPAKPQEPTRGYENNEVHTVFQIVVPENKQKEVVVTFEVTLREGQDSSILSSFYLKHYNGNGWDADHIAQSAAPEKVAGTDNTYKLTFTLTTFSPYALVSETAIPRSSGSSSSGGASTWATPAPTVAPATTPTPGETPGAADVPGVKPIDNPSGSSAKTPAPFLGILAGLGAAAVVFGLRRK